MSKRPQRRGEHTPGPTKPSKATRRVLLNLLLIVALLSALLVGALWVRAHTRSAKALETRSAAAPHTPAVGSIGGRRLVPSSAALTILSLGARWAESPQIDVGRRSCKHAQEATE